MNNAPQGFFSGTNGLDPSSKLPFLPASFSGICRVDVCKGINPRKGGKAFIAELTVMTSNLAALPASDPSYVPVGSRRSWYQAIPLVDATTAHQTCIAFLYASLGKDKSNAQDLAYIEAEIKPDQDEYLNGAVSEENPLGGSFIHVQTTEIQTKRLVNGEPGRFTLHNFAPAKGFAETVTA